MPDDAPEIAGWQVVWGVDELNGEMKFHISDLRVAFHNEALPRRLYVENKLNDKLTEWLQPRLLAIVEEFQQSSNLVADMEEEDKRIDAAEKRRQPRF